MNSACEAEALPAGHTSAGEQQDRRCFTCLTPPTRSTRCTRPEAATGNEMPERLNKASAKTGIR